MHRVMRMDILLIIIIIIIILFIEDYSFFSVYFIVRNNMIFFLRGFKIMIIFYVVVDCYLESKQSINY